MACMVLVTEGRVAILHHWAALKRSWDGFVELMEVPHRVGRVDRFDLKVIQEFVALVAPEA
eukprot:782760-Amorphochlora_amoeboformis.AAC.1